MSNNPTLDLEIILIQTIIDYLDNSISFSKLLNTVLAIESNADKDIPVSLKKMIVTLSTLTRFKQNPIANREPIVTIISNAVNQLEI